MDGSGAIIVNSVAYNNTNAGIVIGTEANAYNCTTVDNGGVGISRGSGVGRFYNCLSHGNTGRDCPAVDGSATVAYCASEDDTADDNGGTGNRVNQTFTFTGYASDNFHLASNDGGARDYGNDYNSSMGTSTDADGETRDGTWDIGADEYVASGGTTAPPWSNIHHFIFGE